MVNLQHYSPLVPHDKVLHAQGSPMPTRSDFAQAIARVAAQGLTASPFETIKTIALGVWQTEEYPPAQVFTGKYLSEAVLLFERLSFYPTVHSDRKRLLLALMSELPDPQTAERQRFCQLFSLFLARLKPLSGGQRLHHSRSEKPRPRLVGCVPRLPSRQGLIWAKKRDILAVNVRGLPEEHKDP
jgi:hypothetical protein